MNNHRLLYVVKLQPEGDLDALCVGPLEAIDARDAAREALGRTSWLIGRVAVWSFHGSPDPALVLETEDEIAEAQR